MDKQSGNQSPFYSSSCSNNRPLSAVMQAVFALSGEVLSRIACVTIEQVYALFADSSITRRTSVVMGKPAVQVSTLTLAHSRQGCTRFRISTTSSWDSTSKSATGEGTSHINKTDETTTLAAEPSSPSPFKFRVANFTFTGRNLRRLSNSFWGPCTVLVLVFIV